MWLIAVTLRRRHCQALAGTLLYNISKALEAGSALGWKVRCLALCLLWGAWTLSNSASIFTVWF